MGEKTTFHSKTNSPNINNPKQKELIITIAVIISDSTNLYRSLTRFAVVKTDSPNLPTRFAIVKTDSLNLCRLLIRFPVVKTDIYMHTKSLAVEEPGLQQV